ncbi:hypothetical protein THAOC_15869, partial [Thalassiosira oceanica]
MSRSIRAFVGNAVIAESFRLCVGGRDFRGRVSREARLLDVPEVAVVVVLRREAQPVAARREVARRPELLELEGHAGRVSVAPRGALLHSRAVVLAQLVPAGAPARVERQVALGAARQGARDAGEVEYARPAGEDARAPRERGAAGAPVAAPPPAVRLEGRAGVGEDARRARSGGEGRLARRGRRGVGEVAGAETRAGRRRRRGGRRRCPEGRGGGERGGSCSESREPHHEESKNNIWNPAGIRAGPSGNGYPYLLSTALPCSHSPGKAPGYPDKKPFDVSFQPTPMLLATAPACPFGIVGIDVVIPSTPQLSPPHNSLDVIEKILANAELAKALDRGKGQNWQTLRFNFGMADRPREKRVEGREWSGSPYARPIATSPLGVDRSAHLQRDYSTLSSSVGSAGTTTIGRKPVATEVGCGIELSPCSAACPLGTIYTSFWPNICAGLLSGTSAAPLSVGLPFEFGFADIRRRRCRGELVYKSTFNVANRRSTETHGYGAIRVALLGAPWFCSVFLGF